MVRIPTLPPLILIKALIFQGFFVSSQSQPIPQPILWALAFGVRRWKFPPDGLSLMSSRAFRRGVALVEFIELTGQPCRWIKFSSTGCTLIAATQRPVITSPASPAVSCRWWGAAFGQK